MSADPHRFLEEIWPLCAGPAAFATRLGPYTLQVEAPGPDWLGPLGDGFWARREPVSGEATFQVRVVERTTIGRLPPLPVTLEQHASRGRIEPWCTEEFLAVGSPWGLTFVDRGRRRAVLYVPRLEALPTWELCAPLRGAIGFLGPELGLHLLHGAAVSDRGAAVLLVGQGGSGKSSSALAALAAEGPLQFVSEDCTLVEVETATVHPLYRSFKLDDRGLARMPMLSGYQRLGFQDPKSCYLLPQGLAPAAAALRAIVWPDRIQSRPMVPISKGTALLKLAPSTLFQNPNAARSDFQALAELCRRLDSYCLGLATDPTAQQVAQGLAGLLRDGGADGAGGVGAQGAWGAGDAGERAQGFLEGSSACP